MDEWTNEEVCNPSGPNIFRLKINEDIRLKILDSIAGCMKNHVHKVFEGGSDRLNNAVKNSIVDGKIGELSEEWLKVPPGNIIKNTIERMLCRYGEINYNMPCLATITDVWYVAMKSGDFHLLHSHHINTEIAELSGAIYLEVPDNLPDPQGNITWVTGGISAELHFPFWESSPKPADVFLWPSWLLHMVYPFRSKQERLMISFNGQIVCE